MSIVSRMVFLGNGGNVCLGTLLSTLELFSSFLDKILVLYLLCNNLTNLSILCIF